MERTHGAHRGLGQVSGLGQVEAWVRFQGFRFLGLYQAWVNKLMGMQAGGAHVCVCVGGGAPAAAPTTHARPSPGIA